LTRRRVRPCRRAPDRSPDLPSAGAKTTTSGPSPQTERTGMHLQRDCPQVASLARGRWRQATSRVGGVVTRRSPQAAEQRHADGDQSGEQIERNRGQLRATRGRSTPLNPARINQNLPAGGRAVAGSNPVSPTRSPCKQRCSWKRRKASRGVQIGRGVHFLQWDAIAEFCAVRSIAARCCTRSPVRASLAPRQSARQRAGATASRPRCSGRGLFPLLAHVRG
jgi:hypothetical protein